MTARFLKQMTALAFMTGVAVLTNAAPARASVSVTYSTIGVFSGGAPGTVITNGGATVQVGSLAGNSATLTFTGMINKTVGPVPPETNAPFGKINAVVTGDGGLFSGVSFALTITQSAPSPTGGTVSFTDTLTGTLTNSSSGLTLVFDTPTTQSFTFATPYGPGTISYRASAEYGIVPAEDGGETTIQGKVNGVVPTPEPGTVALALTGLPLLGFAAWRRRRTHAV